MKKAAALLLCILIMISVASCGGGNQTGGAPLGSSSSKEGGTTLMIYMIGSDLESKSSAATDDLMEIQDSGVDCSSNNVVVYTGGSTDWQNDLVSADTGMILTLGDDGYEVEDSPKAASMGEPETLTYFLNYCAEKHPADHYALILWNHGNGPLIGYGKDMLFDNDSLTLSEMEQAMQTSPFSGEKKLDWVGFDACLMASAELSCIWEPYASYLVASQEVEPAFGWQYSFLKDLGKTGTTELLSGITENYYTACVDFFEKKGYDDRDTTLACVDLSCAGELKEALNALFAAASKDVVKQYDELATDRVNTRALGRASTGSEYDLVDLNDFSLQLAAKYPTESKKLCDVIEKMVLSNATNAPGLSGMSLYCPFYNKSYYENEWAKTYTDMNVFPDYVGFLQEYAKIWLNGDMQDDYATSETPSVETGSKYTLKLTDDQVKHFASAKYYILKKSGIETFSKVYSSSDVSLKDGVLTADFNGNVIYAHNDFDQYCLPVSLEHDTVGSVTNYSVPVRLDNSQGGSFLTAKIGDEKQDVQFMNCRFVIAADNETGEIAVSALKPYDTEQSGSDLLGGKLEEVDTSDFTTYLFTGQQRSTLTRTDKGVVQGVKDWIPTGYHIWSEMPIADGMEFVYAPLAYGDYSLIFEICDTQGSLYCSEPIDIDTSGVDWLKDETEAKLTSVESDGKFPLLLKEDDTFAIYLDEVENNGSKALTLLAENKTDKKLIYQIDDYILNETVYGSDVTTFYETVEPRTKDYPYNPFLDKEQYGPETIDFGNAVNIGAVKELSSLQFDLKVMGYEDKRTVWMKEPVEVRFMKGKEYKVVDEDDWLYDPLLEKESSPVFGATVKPQTIMEKKDQFRIELLYFGEERSSVKAAYRFTNLSETENANFVCDGISIDNVFCDFGFGQVQLPPGLQQYMRMVKGTEILEQQGIGGIQDMKMCIRSSDDEWKLWQGYGEVEWADVKVDKKSPSPSKLNTGDQVLIDENDVTVRFSGYEKDDYGTKSWNMTLENGRSEGVHLEIVDLVVDGKSYPDASDIAPVYMYRVRTGPGQATAFHISTTMLSTDNTDPKELTFRFCVYDFTGGKVLFKTKETVTLRAE